MKLTSPGELEEFREELRRSPARPVVRVCCGTGCRAAGADHVLHAFQKEISKHGLNVEVTSSGCQGWCEKGPLVAIKGEGQDLFYLSVTPPDVPAIVDHTLGRQRPLPRLLYQDPSGTVIPRHEEIPFYRKQMRVVLRNCGRIDPTDIRDYIRVGGYSALVRALMEMTPEEVIEEVRRAGLRGRGGAGFPTARKWAACRAQKTRPKYLICNGDEGDPGAFMDRSVLEGDPHSVIEGMIIAAYAIGNISQGFIYVRAEYPLAVRNLRLALEQARELGLLGENILGTDFSFDIELKRGAGAFVCGEETGLMLSIDGQRGMPWPRPPFPVEFGLWGRPTNINNVKTYASVPVIINRGAEWYASIGTEKSKGTQVFALTGKVRNTGLVEVPMGITIRELVYDIGGGPREGRIKAVQIGGPSGGCIPEHLFDVPVDFDSLQQIGAMMGSGGLVVLDESDCMVHVARYFLSFTQAEACGKCTPCRVGTYRMLRIMDRIVEGKGRLSDLAELERLGHWIKKTALCGLGTTAPNPILTTLRYFRDEYEAHILDGYCPCGVCRSPRHYVIVPEECIWCGLCLEACAEGAVHQTRRGFHIEPRLCTGCGRCRAVCPTKAVVITKEVPV